MSFDYKSLSLNQDVLNQYVLKDGFTFGKETHSINTKLIPKIHSSLAISLRSKHLVDKILTSIKFRRLQIPQTQLNQTYLLKSPPNKENKSRKNNQSLSDTKDSKANLFYQLGTPQKVASQYEFQTKEVQQFGEQKTVKKIQSNSELSTNSQSFAIKSSLDSADQALLLKQIQRVKTRSLSPHLNSETLAQLFQIFSQLHKKRISVDTPQFKQNDPIIPRQYNSEPRKNFSNSIPKASKSTLIKDPIQKSMSRDKLQRNIEKVRSLSILTKSMKLLNLQSGIKFDRQSAINLNNQVKRRQYLPTAPEIQVRKVNKKKPFKGIVFKPQQQQFVQARHQETVIEQTEFTTSEAASPQGILDEVGQSGYQHWLK